MHIKKFYIWLAVIIAAGLLITLGNYGDIMRRGSGICWECIGFE